MTDPADLPPDPAAGPDPEEPPARPRRRRGRRLALVLLMAVLLLIAGELFARFYVGLGDPPLMMTDPQIEYLFKPDQTCRRFGNRIHYNHYSMRSDDFPEHKSNPNELRVLVVGDSVVNGGVLTDQSRIATTLLQERLASDLGRPVVVGNISAGSWGPPNELAYLRRFGLFDADVVVLVLSSHDYADVPTFEPTVGVDPAAPDRKPVSALWEGVRRYLLPRLGWKAVSNEGYKPPATTRPDDVRASLDAIRQIIDLSRRSGAKVILAKHLAREETLANPQAGHAEIAQTAQAAGVTPIQLGDAFSAARQAGQEAYRDIIHPNAFGQRLIADTLLPAIKSALATPAPATRPASPPSGNAPPPPGAARRG